MKLFFKAYGVDTGDSWRHFYEVSNLASFSQMYGERTLYYCPRNASTLLINIVCDSTKSHSFSSLPWKCRYCVT